MLRVLKFVIFGSLLAAAPAFAEGPNAISVELLGRGIAYSINYDRVVSPEIAVGIGFETLSVGASNDNGTQYSAATITIIPLYLNYYLSDNDGSRWFVSGGIDIISASWHNDSYTFSGTGALFTAGGG